MQKQTEVRFKNGREALEKIQASVDMVIFLDLYKAAIRQYPDNIFLVNCLIKKSTLHKNLRKLAWTEYLRLRDKANPVTYINCIETFSDMVGFKKVEWVFKDAIARDQARGKVIETYFVACAHNRQLIKAEQVFTHPVTEELINENSYLYFMGWCNDNQNFAGVELAYLSAKKHGKPTEAIEREYIKGCALEEGRQISIAAPPLFNTSRVKDNGLLPERKNTSTQDGFSGGTVVSAPSAVVAARIDDPGSVWHMEEGPILKALTEKLFSSSTLGEQKITRPRFFPPKPVVYAGITLEQALKDLSQISERSHDNEIFLICTQAAKLKPSIALVKQILKIALSRKTLFKTAWIQYQSANFRHINDEETHLLFFAVCKANGMYKHAKRAFGDICQKKLVNLDIYKAYAEIVVSWQNASETSRIINLAWRTGYGPAVTEFLKGHLQNTEQGPPSDSKQELLPSRGSQDKDSRQGTQFAFFSVASEVGRVADSDSYHTATCISGALTSTSSAAMPSHLLRGLSHLAPIRQDVPDLDSSEDQPHFSTNLSYGFSSAAE